MKKILIFIFLISCGSSNQSDNLINESIDFDKKLTFIEFKDLLEKYNELKSYPDINN